MPVLPDAPSPMHRKASNAGRIGVVGQAIALVAIGQVGISIVAPSLPSMMTGLGVTRAAVQSTLTVYLAAFGAAQFIFGPLCTRFHRSSLWSGSLGLYIIGSLLGASAIGMGPLLASRLLQGCGAGGASALARLMLCEQFEGAALRVATSRVSMGIVLVPLVAPIVGGSLDFWFGWRIPFVLAAVLAGILAMRSRRKWAEPLRLPGFDPSLRTERPFLVEYRRILTNRCFISSALCAACVYGCTTA